MNGRTLALVFLSLPFLGSCAAMFSGTSKRVRIESTPPAHFTAGEIQGTTPMEIEISRSLDEIEFEFPGGETRSLQIDSGFQYGYLFMDILFTPGYGVVGLAVDFGTGAIWDPPATLSYDLESGASVGFEAESPVSN